MDDLLVNYVETNKENLLVSDEITLRENLRLLEEGCKRLDEFKDQEEEILLRRLWLHLVRLGVNAKNIKLCLMLIAKLKLVQLALVLRALLQTNDAANQQIALAHITNYFHLEMGQGQVRLNEIAVSQFGGGRQPLLLDHEQFTYPHIDQGNWRAALRLIDDLYADKLRNGLVKKLIQYRFARDLELEENFGEALSGYAECGTEKYDAPRIIIKQYMNLAYKGLHNYCYSRRTDSYWPRKLWTEYSLAARNNPIHADEPPPPPLLDANDPIVMRAALIKANGTHTELERQILSAMPQVIGEFINGQDSRSTSDKWNVKRKLDTLMIIGESLTCDQRRALAELALRNQQLDNHAKACDLYLALNQTEALVSWTGKFLDPISSIRVACQLGSTNGIALNLMEYINRKRLSKDQSELSERNENSTRFLAYLRLGLIDEALHIFASDVSTKSGEQLIGQAIESLQTVIRTSASSDSSSRVDPEIRARTLERLHRSLLNDQSLVTQVLTVIIQALDIFLLKLKPTQSTSGGDTYDLGQSIRKLETTFKQLANSYLETLNFDASETLVRSTNSLVEAVKERLDVLSDSDIIRQTFRKLVEMVAAKCMIEGRYKSAAALYSQVEDNVSAVKSLMRMGDVDIVINFSLLVRDITVNRLTINYLKHLNVEQEVVQDFISKSNL